MTQKKRIKLIIIIVCSILALGMLSMSTLSFVKFGTFNYPKATMALFSIFNGNDKYVEIKSDPNKIIIATPDNAMQVFEKYVTDSGYTVMEDEQLGALIIVSQENKRQTVVFSLNKYYSLWRWIDK